MKWIILFVSIFIASNLFGQSWNPIKIGQKYNYQIQDSDFISTTIWIDSTRTIDNDTVYYLNRIVEDCDTCPPYIEGYPQYALITNQFLQKTARKTDTSFVFESPEHFIIKPNTKVSDSWIFDDSLGISAQVISIQYKTVFGQQDSIKTIELSTNDTIILSQNYGILRFDSPYDKTRYNLVGINNSIGKSLPDFHDFFNFSVGDLFEYHGNDWQVESDQKFFIRKVQITTKYSSGNTLKYGVHVKEYRRLYALPTEFYHWSKYASYREYDDNWVFVDSLNHPTNLFNKQLTNIENRDNTCDYNLSRIIVKKDSAGLYSKQVGTMFSDDFFKRSETNPDILIRNIERCDEHEYFFTEGLGIVHQDDDGFEWYSYEDLVAYKIGDRTAGEFTNDEDLLVSSNELSSNIPQIYPNPATNSIHIDVHDQPIKATLFNLQGEVVKVYNNTSVLNVGKLKTVYTS